MKTKRLIIFGFLTALIGSLAATLVSPGIASAIGTGQWVDQSKISLDGKDYIDTNVADDRHQFHLNGDDDKTKCVDVIKEFNNGDPAKATKANLVKWRDPLGSVSGVPGNPGEVCFVRSSESFNIDQSTVAKASVAPTGKAKEPNSCESSGGMAWILCPMIKSLDAAMDWLDEQIQALLEIDETAYDNPELYRAWSQIRNIAYIILIPVMLIMVLGTAMGTEFFSAYTVKKALPRMVAAILFITLSYQICTFLIGLANVVGTGTLGLLTSPFNHLVGGGKSVGTAGLSDLFGSGNGVLSGILLLPKIAAVAVGVIIILWLFGVTILLFVGTAFLVLLLRQIFIIALLLLAPLAILAWIFPGNDKLWKTWWGAFSKLLIMFPLIMALIAVGRDMAWLINTPDRAGGLQGTFITPVAKLALYMLPYVFIPFTFKFAGGLFATISGMANDKSKGLFDRQKKKRAEKLHRIPEGRLFNKNVVGGSWKDKINKSTQRAAHVQHAGLRPSRWKTNVDTLIQDQELDHGLEKMDKIPGGKAFFQNDTSMLAGLEGQGDYTKTYNYLVDTAKYTPEQAAITASQVMRMRNEMGGEAFNLAAMAKLPATGTAYVGNDIGQWHQDIVKYSHGNKSLQASLVAMGKSGFRSAQRYEVSEAGFGDHLEALGMVEDGKKNGETTEFTREKITKHVVDKAYVSGGAAAVVGARNDTSARMFAEAIVRDLDKSAKSGDETQMLRSLAMVANIQDQSPGGKKIVTDVLAEKVMSFEVNGQTVLDRINVERGNPIFQQTRRELGREQGMTAAEADLLRQRGGTPQGPGTGLQGPTPGDLGPK